MRIEGEASVGFVGGGQGAAETIAREKGAGVAAAQDAATVAEFLIETEAADGFAETFGEGVVPALFGKERVADVQRLLWGDAHGVGKGGAAQPAAVQAGFSFFRQSAHVLQKQRAPLRRSGGLVHLNAGFGRLCRLRIRRGCRDNRQSCRRGFRKCGWRYCGQIRGHG
jgi:hypothetical protein